MHGSRVSHLWPVNPFGHEHTNPEPVEVQTPLLTHFEIKFENVFKF